MTAATTARTTTREVGNHVLAIQNLSLSFLIHGGWEQGISERDPMREIQRP